MEAALQASLENAIEGDVRFDRLSRTLYSTDASIYEIVPCGVVLPRHQDDVVSAVRLCRDHGVAVVPRGAGTGLTGGAVGHGLQIDCSRHMNGIRELDLEERTIRVMPGVVLDELNAGLTVHGLHFAPDVATSSRATIGGMIANNSCGAHSILYGRTVDHVASLTAVMADGSVESWPKEETERISTGLADIANAHREHIVSRYPKVMRRSGGYALDRILDQPSPVNPVDIVCGSEGTLCFVTEAVLRLTPLPKHRAILLVHFRDLDDALSATPTLLEHRPAAVELLDTMVLDAARQDPTTASVCGFLEPSAAAVLIVEFFDVSREQLRQRAEHVRNELVQHNIGFCQIVMDEPSEQGSVWEMRRRGLGLLMSRPGDRQTHAFVEDSAVDPKRLSEYIGRFRAIMADEGVRETSYYAHASVGVIHVRPVLNLKSTDDIGRLRRIAERAADLALKFGGALTGEHGDGIVRSCWLEKMYGRGIVRAFRHVKELFDPDRVFNPGKIVDPWPMTENLRYGTDYVQRSVKTHLEFAAHGGMAGLAEMCCGVGQCRQRLVGTMCPSFMATGDETHTTRARANALRSALSNRGLIDGLDDPALDDVMDLCLLCKACKTECPTGVDMARLKVEWLSRRNRLVGVSRGSRLAADVPKLSALGSRLTWLSNGILQSNVARRFLERNYGFDARVPFPKFARTTFRRWFAGHQAKHRKRLSRGRPVVYFVDTWTNYYRPFVGIAAVRVLEAAGYSVRVVPHECCGRTLISKGLLTEATTLARRNVEKLTPFADAGMPIVGTEPSCILTLLDEYPQLLRNLDANAVAGVAGTVESLLARTIDRRPDSLKFTRLCRRLLYHPHCHQRAIVGSAEATRLLNAPPGFTATEIDAGCCGMAGAFGHEREHYDIAKAVGSQRLFPAVFERGSAEIAVSGFSCRHQIEHHTGVESRHVVEHLSDAIAD